MMGDIKDPDKREFLNQKIGLLVNFLRIIYRLTFSLLGNQGVI